MPLGLIAKFMTEKGIITKERAELIITITNIKTKIENKYTRN